MAKKASAKPVASRKKKPSTKRPSRETVWLKMGPLWLQSIKKGTKKGPKIKVKGGKVTARYVKVKKGKPRG